MYNSQYYTCEQIDERLLQGYLDDYNTQTGQSLTKAQFLTKLGNTFSKEGVIDNIATQVGYYECDTAAGTAAKTITVANYALFAGGSMKVKFVNENTANNATLNINSQGDKALYYQGERASATNSWDANEVVEIYYDGTSYYANNVKGGSGSGVYDVSKEHPTSGPNSDGKFTLEYILNSSNVNELIPVNKRYPGMSIQFVSTSDNKYVQYRLIATSFSTNVSDWQGVDEEPTIESNNLVKSDGVARLGIFKLENIGGSGVGYITGVGQFYFNTNSNTLRYCTSYRNGDNFNTIGIEPSYRQLYVYNNMIYRWNGTSIKPVAHEYVGYSQLNLDILTQYEAYKDTIAEVYVVAPIQSGVSLGIKKYGTNIYLTNRLTNGYTEWRSGTNISTFKNNTVYPLLATVAGTDVNIGDIVGYVVFKDIEKFKSITDDTGFGRIIDKKQATDIMFNPIIASYLLYTPVLENLMTSVTQMASAFDYNYNTIENTSVSNATWEAETSTFCGWGMPLCENKSIKKVVINIKNRDSEALTSVQLWLRKDSGAGDVLVIKTLSVNIAAGSSEYVTFEFDDYVGYSGLIYLQYICDKLVSRFGWIDASGYPYKYSLGYPRCGYYIKGDSMYYDSSADESASYVKYYTRDYFLADKQIENIKERLDIIGNNDVEIDLPNVINCIVGDTLQLYYKSILRCVNPYIYDIKVTCNVGAQYPRYYELTPTEGQIGNHTITFTVRDNNKNVIKEKSVILKVCKKVNNPASSLNILCVGASNMVGGQWVGEFKKRLTTSEGTPTTEDEQVLYTPIGFSIPNVNFVGRVLANGVNLEATGGYNFNSYLSTNLATVRFFFTQANAPQGINIGDVYSDGTTNFTITEINIPDASQQGGYYGNINCSVASLPSSVGNNLTRVSGTGDSSLTASSHTSAGNPFVHNGVIDIENYADNYCNGSIDIVYTDLFGNDIITQYQDDFTAAFASVQQFIDMFRAEFPNCKFCIAMSQNKDEKGGLGVNYGASYNTPYAYPYGLKYSCQNLLTQFQKYIDDNQLGDYVYIMNTLNEFDVENDYRQTEKQVNPRSSVKEIFGVNGAHPSNIGYYQIADSAVRVFIAKFCQ